MGLMSLVDGSGAANLAGVNDRNHQLVEAKSSRASMENLNDTVGTTSKKLFNLDAFNADALQLQNKSGAATLYIRFGTAAATAADYQIGPGQTYMLPGGIRWEGQIQIIASAAGTAIAGLIWRGADEETT